MPEIWERLPAESSKVYAYFCAYRDLGAKRSLSKLNEHIGGKPSFQRKLEDFSSRFQWQLRVKAYDDHLDKMQREEFEKQRIDLVGKQAAVTEAMMGLLVTRFKSIKEGGEEQDLSPKETLELMEKAIKLQRMVYGLATENVQQETTANIKVSGKIDTNQIVEDPELCDLACTILEKQQKVARPPKK